MMEAHAYTNAVTADRFSTDDAWTPGPWYADWRHGFDSRDRSQWGWAEVCSGEDAILRADRGTPDDIANVCFAASAPDMYALLMELFDYFDDQEDADCEGDPLRYVPNEAMQWAERIREVTTKARMGVEAVNGRT